MFGFCVDPGSLFQAGHHVTRLRLGLLPKTAGRRCSCCCCCLIIIFSVLLYLPGSDSGSLTARDCTYRPDGPLRPETLRKGKNSHRNHVHDLGPVGEGGEVNAIVQTRPGVRAEKQSRWASADVIFFVVVKCTFVRAAFGIAMIHGARSVVRSLGNDESLEENSVFEFKSLVEGIGNVAGHDPERDGHIALLQNIIDLEVAHDRSSPAMQEESINR